MDADYSSTGIFARALRKVIKTALADSAPVRR
jgi:hypothetical protein